MDWNTLLCPGDLLTKALSGFSLEKGGWGLPPVNVRGVGERHEIVKQTDSGFGVDAQAGPGDPLSPDPPCSSGLST